MIEGPMRIACKLALKSEHSQHRHGAVIVKGGNIISTGYNQLRPSNVLKTETLHAEAHAILKVLNDRRHSDLVGATMYVSRWTRGGILSLSRPCPSCTDLCRSVGIYDCVYTTVNGQERMKF